MTDKTKVKDDRKWTAEKFQEFHERNPQIFVAFEAAALEATRFRVVFSARAIYQRMRWNTYERGEVPFKLDDGWLSHYARLFARYHPEHKDLFSYRCREGGYHEDGVPDQYCKGCQNLLVPAFDFICPVCQGV